MSAINIPREINKMTEQLPITISLCDQLVEKFSKIKSLSNKLEAQFNFQTLTAGWYGDEDNMLSIGLVLQSPEVFAWQQKQQHGGKLHQFADDVLSYHNERQISCFIAITDSELNLLQQRPKLLNGYIQTKIHKVLGLIAKQHNLPDI
jgi:hypothetical protein